MLQAPQDTNESIFGDHAARPGADRSSGIVRMQCGAGRLCYRSHAQAAVEGPSLRIAFVVRVRHKGIAMIGETKRLLEARRAVLADRQKTIGEAEALLLTNAIQPLAECNRDRGCNALASQL